MRLKKESIIGIIGVLLIIFGIISYFVIELKEEKDTINEDVTKVVENYSKYKNFAEETSNWKVENIPTNIFIEEVNTSYSSWIEIYDQYKSKLEEHETYAKDLKKLCINKTYNDSDVTSKCDAFIIAYETLVNYYVDDVNNFNKLLEDYRTSTTIIDKLDNITDFDKGNFDYIDINDDGEYTGMNSAS